MISQKVMFFAYTSSYMQDALKLKESLLSACHNKGYLLYQKEIESNIIIMRTELSYFFINWIKKAIFIYHYSLVIVFCCFFLDQIWHISLLLKWARYQYVQLYSTYDMPELNIALKEGGVNIHVIL